MMRRDSPVLTDMRHTKLCYSKERYCGHPRQSGIFNYGNGEIAVLHAHAPSRYEVREDISHFLLDRLSQPRQNPAAALVRSRRDVAAGARRGGVGRDSAARGEAGDSEAGG